MNAELSDELSSAQMWLLAFHWEFYMGVKWLSLYSVDWWKEVTIKIKYCNLLSTIPDSGCKQIKLNFFLKTGFWFQLIIIRHMLFTGVHNRKQITFQSFLCIHFAVQWWLNKKSTKLIYFHQWSCSSYYWAICSLMFWKFLRNYIMRFGVLCLMNKHRQIKGTIVDWFYLNTLTARNQRKTFINNLNFQYRSSEILFIYNDKQ